MAHPEDSNCEHRSRLAGRRGLASVLTRDQQESFRSRGLLHVEGLLPVDRVEEAHAAAMHAFEAPANRPHKGKLRGASQSRPVRDLLSSELLGVVEELTCGRSVRPMGGRPQLLVTMPNAQDWAVPSTVWHVDTPRVAAGMIGVQVFVLLHEVRHAGGGTLMVAGSHRLLNTGTRLGSKEIKRRLKRMPYFRDLMSSAPSTPNVRVSGRRSVPRKARSRSRTGVRRVGRNAARGAPATTRRARPQAPPASLARLDVCPICLRRGRLAGRRLRTR
ncbi:MAG: hypothetical protein F4X98_18255 [Gammaproteobacteria bacterium]|nr:hypothetical protein [Gammaproteobacteria bacterium]